MKQHSPRFLSLVTEVKNKVKEITPQELKTILDAKHPLYLIDVREDKELSSGVIPTSIHLSKGIIERDIEKTISDPNAPIVLYCSGGFRSALAADNLIKMGYNNVSSLVTGFNGWTEKGFKSELKKT